MTTLRNIVLLAAGSGGDVAPFATIGQALAARGYTTTLVAPMRYAAYAASAGIAFESIGADDVFDDVFNADDVWHPTRGLAASWRYYAAAMQSGHNVVRAKWQPTNTAIVSSSFAVAARALQENHGYYNASVHLSPAVIFSHERPARWAKSAIPPSWPTWIKQLLARTAERYAVDPTIRRALTPAATALGLQLPPFIFSQWIHSPTRVFYAFPSWFCAAANDWPANAMHVGFPTSVAATTNLAPELQSFINRDGRKLAIVTAGTAVRTNHDWIENTCRALLEAGWKVVLVGQSSTQMTSEALFKCAFAPFTTLFAHADVVIHHGGIGTMCEAMRAGVPQVACPTAHDQHDNAARLAALGAGIDASALRGSEGVVRNLGEQLDSLRQRARRRQITIAAEPSAAESVAAQVERDWDAR